MNFITRIKAICSNINGLLDHFNFFGRFYRA